MVEHFQLQAPQLGDRNEHGKLCHNRESESEVLWDERAVDNCRTMAEQRPLKPLHRIACKYRFILPPRLDISFTV